jgi:hypothetical protein
VIKARKQRLSGKITAETTDLLVKRFVESTLQVFLKRSDLFDCVTWSNTNGSSEFAGRNLTPTPLNSLAMESRKLRLLQQIVFLLLRIRRASTTSLKLDYTDDSKRIRHKNLDKEPVDSSETTKRKTKAEKTKTHQVEAGNGGGGCC